MNILRWVPGVATLRNYEISSLPRDLAAGLTLGAVMVPVGLAYGELAGLPMAGLYGSMLPLLAYALFGSSRHLVVGPDTAMAAIVAVAVAPLALGDPARLALLAAGLGVMVGLICLLAGVLRLGFVANLLSKPVIVGFMQGLALVIVGAQLPKVLGFKVEGETTVDQLVATARRLEETNVTSLAIGASCFAVILACRRLAPRLPGAVIALAGAMVAVMLFGLDRHGVALIGRIPTGLPELSLPLLSLGDFDALLPVALVAALLSFSDTMVTARAFGARHGTRVDADQELLGIGAAILVSGLTQGLPISASDTRTAVAEAAGSQKQMTMVVAAAIVGGITLWLADLLYYLPTAALAGILIASAWGLCDLGELGRLWRFRGSDLAAALLTMTGVVALGVMDGILVGVVFSLVLLLRALAFPPDAVLGRVPAGSWHDPAYRADAVMVPGLLVYRFSSPLFFANCELFRERVETRLAEAPYPVHRVVIDGAAIHAVDLMACDLLVELERELRTKGIALVFGNLRDRVRRDIERGLRLSAGEGEGDFVHPTVEAAATPAFAATVDRPDA